MINPSELRIGNYIEINRDQFAKVVTINGESAIVGITTRQNFYLTSSFIRGIELTPEWLERCGFKKVSDQDWDGPTIEHENEIEYFSIREFGNGFYRLMGSEWPMGKPFQFVHQLQNLFYCHAEEELTIKDHA